MAVDYAQAVQTLKSRFGGRWDGDETGGRGELVRVLREEHGYSQREADDAIDAMIESGSIRYVREREQGAPEEHLPTAPVNIAGSPSGTTGNFSNVPLAPGVLAGGFGYWQIGDGSTDSATRKGQVDPTL